MTQKTSRFYVLAAGALLVAATLTAQSITRRALVYPRSRTVDVVDRFGSTTVSDPYRWLEELNAPETAQWVASKTE